MAIQRDHVASTAQRKAHLRNRASHFVRLCAARRQEVTALHSRKHASSPGIRTPYSRRFLPWNPNPGFLKRSLYPSSPYTFHWRRERDSNPRHTFWMCTRFPVAHLQPLGHLSMQSIGKPPIEAPCSKLRGMPACPPVNLGGQALAMHVHWRRERDSNPRPCKTEQLISSQPPSSTRASLHARAPQEPGNTKTPRDMPQWILKHREYAIIYAHQHISSRTIQSGEALDQFP